MLREFFAHAHLGVRACAWLGLLVFVAHQAFRAHVAYRLNAFYREFYDALGESGSGEAERRALEAAVREQLAHFVRIVAPVVVVHPCATLARNAWLYAWRVALVRSYLRRWSLAETTVEGAAQRVHEDTQRFADAFHGFFAMALESLITLCIFLPVLRAIDATLFAVALALSLGGIGVSAIVGHPLVALEVNNQRVEASLRTKLVLLETDAARFVRDDAPAAAHFRGVLAELYRNYARLYAAFFAFSWWLSAFDQFTVVVPYLIAAPRLFRADEPYTLGELIQATNAFGKVFGSISIISDSWASINAFRSVCRRLRGFERWLDAHARDGRAPSAAVPAEAAEAELVGTPHACRSDGEASIVV